MEEVRDTEEELQRERDEKRERQSYRKGETRGTLEIETEVLRFTDEDEIRVRGRTEAFNVAITK